MFHKLLSTLQEKHWLSLAILPLSLSLSNQFNLQSSSPNFLQGWLGNILQQGFLPSAPPKYPPPQREIKGELLEPSDSNVLLLLLLQEGVSGRTAAAAAALL